MNDLSDFRDKLIPGRKIADDKTNEIAQNIINFKALYQIVPKLAVILVGEDPASIIYIRNKIKKATEVGISVAPFFLEKSISEIYLLELIENLNLDSSVHGILIQLPLPNHLNSFNIINKVTFNKDVDGFSAISTGLLALKSNEGFTPCTPMGCMELLKNYVSNFNGLHAVVVGRSNIVGRPMANLLLNKNCTVTICHSHTKNLKKITASGDIVVTSIGKPYFFTDEYFKEDAIVIDVGINRIKQGEKEQILGDVDINKAIKKVKFITPVPNGVGPMTIACLLENTYQAALRTVIN